MKLVIIESPGKIKHLKEILGTGYSIMATGGHMRRIADTGAYNIGVNTKNGFEIDYEFEPSKKDTIKKIKEAAKTATEIWVCSDPDREGELIADEIRTLLGSKYLSKIKRTTFNEISKKAVEAAFKNPTGFDENMIEAANTRNALDKLVGYRLSGLALSTSNCESAGRVQSALLKLLAERERQIQAFVPVDYWDIFLDFKKGAKLLTAKLKAINKKKIDKILDKSIVDDVLENCISGGYTVESISEKEKLIEPKLPLTTSAMQQMASSRLGFAPARSQKIAQSLYEQGKITYIRTDAVRFADEFIEEAKKKIIADYGKEYYRGLCVPANKNSSAQDAHESIRPTDINVTPSKSELSGDELKLYTLIYNISLSALFVPAKVKVTDMTIDNSGKYKFGIQGKQIIFASFLDILDIDDDDTKTLPAFKKGESILDKDLYSEQKQTQPPQRYSEGGLTKLMETTGIGRPSSYAPTIETLKKREYIVIEKKAVKVTEKGLKLDALLQKYFPTIINEEYTSTMELDLDKIATGSETRLESLSRFWKEFEPLVLTATREANKDKPKPKEVGRKCPKCGHSLIIRTSKYGNEFICCSWFPKCKYTESLSSSNSDNDSEHIQCPGCGDGHMVKRKSKKGETFWGCSRWPKCNKTMNEDQMKEYLSKLNPTSTND